MWSRRQKPPPPAWFRGPVLFLLLSCTARNIFPLELLEPVQIPDESLLLKTKKCSLQFFNRWLLSPSQHSFPAYALLNYSIPVSERELLFPRWDVAALWRGALCQQQGACVQHQDKPTHSHTAFTDKNCLFPPLSSQQAAGACSMWW